MLRRRLTLVADVCVADNPVSAVDDSCHSGRNPGLAFASQIARSRALPV